MPGPPRSRRCTAESESQDCVPTRSHSKINVAETPVEASYNQLRVCHLVKGVFQGSLEMAQESGMEALSAHALRIRRRIARVQISLVRNSSDFQRLLIGEHWNWRVKTYLPREVIIR